MYILKQRKNLVVKIFIRTLDQLPGDQLNDIIIIFFNIVVIVHFWQIKT